LNAECFGTDGSQLPHGHTGAAVIRKLNGQFEEQDFYLGTNKEAFVAELYAIYAALHSAQLQHDAGQVFTKVAIFCDAQAALRRLRNANEGPGLLLARSAFFSGDLPTVQTSLKL
jgi:hypothetical protein